MELARRTFDNNGLNIRITALIGVDNDGNERIYFLATEVARHLGYRDPNDAVRRHVRERHTTRLGDVGFVAENEPRRFPGGMLLYNRNTMLITEPGVWKLVIRSNMPEAQDFQDWVCEDVIPAIRRTGRYELPNNPCHVVRSIEMGSVENLEGKERREFHNKCVKMANATKDPERVEMGRAGGATAAHNRRQKYARLEFLEAEVVRLKVMVADLEAMVVRLRDTAASNEDRIGDLETEVALLRGAMDD